jgi:septum formation protein
MGKNQSLKLPYPLILASTSKYRGELLSQLGWDFEMMKPGVDEERVKQENHSPSELSLLLSKYKAQAVFVKRPEACVIGSDQVCTLDGKIFDKPGSIEAATEQISLLQGKTHELITAVTLVYLVGVRALLIKQLSI